MAMESDFLRQLRATFQMEAREHLQSMTDGLLRLEGSASVTERAELVPTVFRAAHSLKGAARAVELNEMEGLCQSLEDVLAHWRERPPEDAVPAGSMDVLHRCLDVMGTMLDAVQAGAAPTVPPDLPALRRQLRQFAKGIAAAAAAKSAVVRSAPSWSSPAVVAPAAPAAQAPVPASVEPPADGGVRVIPAPNAQPAPVQAVSESAAPAAASEPVAGSLVVEARQADTVRVPLPKLAAQLLGAEEMLTAKLAAGQRVLDHAVFADWLADWRKAWSAVESEVRRMRMGEGGQGAEEAAARPDDGLRRVLGFFDWSSDAMHAIEGRLLGMGRSVRHDRDVVGKLVDDLVDSAKQLLLLPFSTISPSFAKLVRDLCRDQDKQADFSIVGEQIEIDKLILEEMKDPLVHMLRNAVDHGLESQAERQRLGKPARARIALEVSRAEGNKVRIVLRDDGGGIVPERVRTVAVSRGIVSAEEAERADAHTVMQWVFRPELSTSASVSRVSGRGLGLAIVLERARRLGGDASVTSVPGQGTEFTVVLPAGRATYRGVLCEAGGQQFLVATTAVERVLRVRRDAVHSVESHESTAIGDRVVGVVRLVDALGIETTPTRTEPGEGQRMVPLLLIGKAEAAIAFEIDRVLDEQEVLVKPLRRPLLHVRNVEAAAVLGSGRMVPILRVSDLLRSARRVAGRGARAAADAAGVDAERPRRVLMAEDSITSRMLLKTILESAGFEVTTAVDGLEAYSFLRTGEFDLLVSDVEMPRLNGFDLTARVRADRRLRDLPVVLVTALETRADRERGVDVGANAYIAKGSFDQNDLISTVRRLL